MTTQNQTDNKNQSDKPAASDTDKQRPGVDPKHPSNADYDYRADRGETGGGVEHNPELDTDTVQNPSQKPVEKKQ